MNADKVDILESEKYIADYFNELDFNIRNKSKKQFKERLKSMNADNLKKIRNLLALEVYDEYNLKEGEMYLKNRKGNKIIESYSEDIYNLSYFYLDRKFSDPLDDIFSVGVKPGVFIKYNQIRRY